MMAREWSHHRLLSLCFSLDHSERLISSVLVLVPNAQKKKKTAASKELIQENQGDVIKMQLLGRNTKWHRGIEDGSQALKESVIATHL